MTFSPKIGIAAAAMALLAACSQPPLPEDQFYRLELGQSGGHSPQPLTGVVEVSRFIADGLTADRPIVYTSRESGHRLKAYHYHFWTEPPTVMLQNALAGRLRAVRFANNIVTPDLRIEPDFVISGKIRRFEQVTGNPNAVVAEIELVLKEMQTERLLHQQTYRVETETPSASVSGAVAALSQTVGQIFDSFLGDLSNKRP